MKNLARCYVRPNRIFNVVSASMLQVGMSRAGLIGGRHTPITGNLFFAQQILENFNLFKKIFDQKVILFGGQIPKFWILTPNLIQF